MAHRSLSRHGGWLVFALAGCTGQGTSTPADRKAQPEDAAEEATDAAPPDTAFPELTAEDLAPVRDLGPPDAPLLDAAPDLSPPDALEGSAADLTEERGDVPDAQSDTAPGPDLPRAMDALPDGLRLYCPPPPPPQYGTCGATAFACRCRCGPTDWACQEACAPLGGATCVDCITRAALRCCPAQALSYAACTREASMARDGAARCTSLECVQARCASTLTPLRECVYGMLSTSASCRAEVDGCRGLETCPADGGVDAGPPDTCRVVDCRLSCTASSVTYSCSTPTADRHTTSDSRCGVRTLVLRFTNGHTVSCGFECFGARGSCADDTGATCAF
ncbi:MAG: hypothetical protein HY909_03135 [Deltaproteobacteria bacterium]|nr:hypothetical protein [Deltaproteobacteria bacterium]